MLDLANEKHYHLLADVDFSLLSGVELIIALQVDDYICSPLGTFCARRCTGLLANTVAWAAPVAAIFILPPLHRYRLPRTFSFLNALYIEIFLQRTHILSRRCV